ncbi:MAG: type II toxin-antitoxin system HicB family antitoxin [Deltaproteobacteria bacterium]|nr:type II toxin-antitoxin system HicB family antitoxin [Deltaproteobacteria bacterium]
MISIMEIDGYKAVIKYDPGIGMFRGEFIGLNGGADFYATSVDGLRKEGKKSLKIFLKMCVEDGVNPRRKFSGRFNLRISPNLHERIAALADASGKSINTWMVEALDHETSQQSD